MSQLSKVGKVATTVRGKMQGGFLSVVYHQTEVVRVENGTITLNHGGWLTATTKTRMNQAANQYGLPFMVYQRNGSWFVDRNGKTLEWPSGQRVVTLSMT